MVLPKDSTWDTKHTIVFFNNLLKAQKHFKVQDKRVGPLMLIKDCSFLHGYR